MKKAVLLALLLLAFVFHAKSMLGEQRLMAWVANHAARAMAGESSACDDYSDKLEVTLRAEGARGHWEVEGGKDEMCGYLKQAAAAYTVLQAQTRSEFDQVAVTGAGFPWLGATISYVERTQVQAPAIPALTVESHETLQVVRTWSGLKIKRIEAQSSGGL